jgi:hypothetical protein
MCGSSMPLLSVLHVPSFPINLLSISCITKELNCDVVFFPTWCLFQELGNGKKILGTGIMRDDLYYLDDKSSPVAAAVLSQSPMQEFLLHHRRLGHMSFNTLGQLYPNLYNNIYKESLICDACRYGKITCSSYISSDHRSDVPFQTIHSDVWGRELVIDQLARAAGAHPADPGSSPQTPRWCSGCFFLKTMPWVLVPTGLICFLCMGS